ncbi:hypothetical protein FB451DRAFT_1175250 [Mycena latifolia]|nr:hypothetical protein FB451DRAFT_1175250 [Mycena latifolia]
MHARNPHGSSAALRAARTELVRRVVRGFWVNVAPVPRVLCSLTILGRRGSARRASERTSTRMRGLGGGAIDGAPSCASCGRESERSDGSTRAREGQQVRSFKVGRTRRVSRRRCGFDTGDSADALVARWTGRAAACAGVRCPGRAQSVRRRHSLDCAELEVVYSGAGGYK